MAVENDEVSKTAVRTYVPEYQRDAWDDHAEELDMSRSEFVRSMVQAGRRGFDPGGQGPTSGSQAHSDSDGTPDGSEPDESAARTATPVDGFESLVLTELQDGCRSWDELFEAVTDEVGDRLESTLDELQADNRIKYSGREGGYVRVE
jgi:hypothetical protein